jgi:hypothetical protein
LRSVLLAAAYMPEDVLINQPLNCSSNCGRPRLKQIGDMADACESITSVRVDPVDKDGKNASLEWCQSLSLHPLFCYASVHRITKSFGNEVEFHRDQSVRSFGGS